ncbi:MAG: mechanosensitive ion channel family protein [Desulfobulbaceae bacterium]|nr:mechanosensitive ion channel family protein [Desulfobulbaceae bacterium]
MTPLSSIVSPHTMKNINESAMALGLVLIAYAIANLIANKKIKDVNELYNWKKAIFYCTIATLLVVIGRIWVTALQPLFTLLTIIAAALTITHKEPIINFTGGLFIAWRNIFSIGDRIQVAGYRGDVVGESIFYFTLLEISDISAGSQSTGRLVKVPNGLVLTNAITNYTRLFPYLWNEISITLLPSSNWQKAEKLLLEITDKHTKQFLRGAQEAIVNAQKKEAIIFRKITPKIYISLQMNKPAGIKITSRYICEARAIRDVEGEIWRDILLRFREHDDITISYDISVDLL